MCPQRTTTVEDDDETKATHTTVQEEEEADDDFDDQKQQPSNASKKKKRKIALFFGYNGDGYQETELTRIEGVGFSWLLTSYMGTVIHEHQDTKADGTAQDAGKNSRICKITGVIA